MDELRVGLGRDRMRVLIRALIGISTKRLRVAGGKSGYLVGVDPDRAILEP